MYKGRGPAMCPFSPQAKQIIFLFPCLTVPFRGEYFYFFSFRGEYLIGEDFNIFRFMYRIGWKIPDKMMINQLRR